MAGSDIPKNRTIWYFFIIALLFLWNAWSAMVALWAVNSRSKSFRTFAGRFLSLANVLSIVLTRFFSQLFVPSFAECLFFCFLFARWPASFESRSDGPRLAGYEPSSCRCRLTPAMPLGTSIVGRRS